MKKYISIFIVVLAVFSMRANAQDTIPQIVEQSSPVSLSDSSTPKEKWDKANIYYQNGEYTSAILLYEELLGANEHSEKVYYNLGNAYFKNNNLGKAILNFNRALLLNPGDEDTKHNLAVATARTIDKIEPIPQFFLKKWIVDLGGILSSNGWAVAVLVFLALTLGGVVLWLTTLTLRLRKVGFYTAFISLIVTVASLIYSQSSFSRLTYSEDAIVMNTAAPVKSAPDGNSKDLFLLHEGTLVTVLDSVQGWSEIRLEDGNKGWIQTTAIEQIVRK